MTIEVLAELETQTAATTPPTRILIVDDDADQALALSLRLQKQGFETTTVDSGRAALHAASSFRPQLILLDVGLPDMSGLEVCERLVDSEDTCGTPVLIISGSDSDDIVRRCRAAGSEFFIRKPYDPNVVLVLIERALDGPW